MKLKLLVLSLYAIVLAAALLAKPFSIAAHVPSSATLDPQFDCDRIRSDDATARVIKLDLKGTRGVVLFRHKHHERYINLDNQVVHPAQRGAECLGCHHKRTEFSGVPILLKCSACHGGEGDTRNPANKEGDEEWSKRAFHDLCIGCHRSSNTKGLTKCGKAPVACNECHGPKS